MIRRRTIIFSAVSFFLFDGEIKNKLTNLLVSLRLYWNNIRSENEQQNELTGFVLPINTEASFVELDKDLEEEINSLGDDASFLAGRLDGIWEELLSFLKEQGVDTSKIEAVPYGKNPFWQPNWETTHLAIPNTRSRLRQISTQMSLKYYEIILANNIELSKAERERFELQKDKLSEYATKLSLYD